MTTQTEPIAEPHLDTLIENMAECFRHDFQDALLELIERRDDAYAKAVAGLDDERMALAQESAEIEEAIGNLEPLLAAKDREANRQADSLLLEGQQEQAEEKLAESAAARNAPGAMRARQREIEARYQAIEGEKETAAREVISAWLRECQKVTLACERGFLITLLDGLKQSLAAFKERTGTTGWDPRFGFLGTGDLTAGAGSAAHAIGCGLYEHDYPVRVRVTGEVRA